MYRPCAIRNMIIHHMRYYVQSTSLATGFVSTLHQMSTSQNVLYCMFECGRCCAFHQMSTSQ